MKRYYYELNNGSGEFSAENDNQALKKLLDIVNTTGLTPLCIYTDEGVQESAPFKMVWEYTKITLGTPTFCQD